MKEETKTKAIRLTDYMLETARAYIASGQEHTATLFTLMDDGEDYRVIAVILTPLPNDRMGKAAIAHAIGEIVEPFDAYVFLTEGWMVQMKFKEEPKGPLSMHPQRIETFQLNFVTKFGDQLMRSWRILRPKGKPAELVHDHDSEIVTEGLFANFYAFSMGSSQGSH